MIKIMSYPFKTLEMLLAGTVAILLTTERGYTSPLPAQSQQALVVKTETWDSTQATLQRYTKKVGVKGKSVWQPVGKPIVVVLGKGGLGWGIGLHNASMDTLSPSGSKEPMKQEGDGKSPAGIFKLGSAYGYASRSLSRMTWPYQTSTQDLRCVDDVKSSFYNQILPKKPNLWNSEEVMRRKDALYTWVLDVDHNKQPATPGKGSCIFLHVWRGKSNPTVGCTAMTQKNLEQVLSWLDPKAQPLLIQLPKTTYKTLQTSWELP
jgi:L,D-peptidoglycan transpeptidase YkuD (ErfK/YbiS/YcfS/YnhG family)